MKKNIGPVDGFIRTAAGLVIILVGFYYRSWWGLLGIVPLLTAWTGVCLLYRLFGINTCRKPS